jgi:hypothetical protein
VVDKQILQQGRPIAITRQASQGKDKTTQHRTTQHEDKDKDKDKTRTRKERADGALVLSPIKGISRGSSTRVRLSELTSSIKLLAL